MGWRTQSCGINFLTSSLYKDFLNKHFRRPIDYESHADIKRSRFIEDPLKIFNRNFKKPCQTQTLKKCSQL